MEHPIHCSIHRWKTGGLKETILWSKYFNWKQFHSIVLLPLVDRDRGCRRRCLDGQIFNNSELYEKLQDTFIGLPRSKSLIE